MANLNAGAWRHSEVLQQSHASTAIDSDGGRNSYDDGLDFPPFVHPIRELITFSIFMSGVIGLVVWGGSKLL
jgi:hypothetical protein